MGRRHVKEFRPDEALSLISADRAGKLLSCPSCGSQSVARDPERDSADRFANAKVQLACGACGRLVSYIDRAIPTPADQH